MVTPTLCIESLEFMSEKKQLPLKMYMRFELAYEIIFYSVLFILIGIAYVFASNLLAFNWYTVFFGALALILLALKRLSYVTIENDVLSVYYFKFFNPTNIQMITISECLFYKESSVVEVKSSDKVILRLHLSSKNKEKLINWLVQYYPDIPCLYINKKRNG